ncbi:DUF2585 family protein [Aurantimonas sp. A2-1-M11]|uniref:DUF2585 family protein n=1 Tax=Aurantimonas sp. A2-1-M11 TaxID=3113712 RepID=UPI002F95BE85
MSDTGLSAPRQPGAGFMATTAGQIVAILLIVLAMVAWLTALGRPLVCPCGNIEFWQGDLSPEENSQQFSDWYSGLHVVFGMALFGFITWMKPHWSIGAKLVIAIASSAMWEAMENTPFLIALFAVSPDAPDYRGDSILNAAGDTIFVVAGFLAATSLPVWASVLLAIAFEVAISLAIDDGFVIGTLRLLGVPL